MSVLRFVCVLAAALWATAVVADPSSLWNVIHPTGCNSAALTPTVAGTYNVTVWDRCQATAESVQVEVKCGWPRIPAENFTVIATPVYFTSNDPDFGGNTQHGAVRITTHACFDPEQRELGYNFKLRYPWYTADDEIDDLGDDTDGEIDFWFNYSPSYLEQYFGTYTFISTVWDGCHIYQHNISVHWDGNVPRVVPSGTPAQSRQPGCQKYSIRFLDSAHDMVYGVVPIYKYGSGERYQNGVDIHDMNDPNDFGFWSTVVNYNQWWWNWFGPSTSRGYTTTFLVAEIAPAASPNGKPPANNQTDINWDLLIPDDKYLVSLVSSHSTYDVKTYIIVDKAYWPSTVTPPGVTYSANYTRAPYKEYDTDNPSVESYFYPGNASSPVETYYDRYSYGSNSFGAYTTNTSFFFRTETMIPESMFTTSTSMWYKIPACKLVLTQKRGALATLSAVPVANAFGANYASCVGNYKVNVSAASYWYDDEIEEYVYPGCTQIATQAVSISCGLPDEIRPSLDNPKYIAVDPSLGGPATSPNYYQLLNSDWDSLSVDHKVTLSVNVYDSYGSQVNNAGIINHRIRWSVVSEPAGSSLGADMEAAYKIWLTSMGSSDDFNTARTKWNTYNPGNTVPTQYQLKPPIGYSIDLRPVQPGTYVFNITHFNGCQSTSVLEYFTINCPGTPSVTFGSGYASLSAATTTYDGGNNWLQGVTISVSDSTQDSDYYRRKVTITDYPKSLPWRYETDYVPSTSPLSGTFLSTFKAWGPGTYKLSVVSDHGCGTQSTSELTYTLQCAVPGTVGIDAQDSSFTATISTRINQNIKLRGQFSQTHAYTSQPTNRRHSWILQSKDGVAVSAAQQKFSYFDGETTSGANSGVATYTSTTKFSYGPGTFEVPVGVYVFKHVVDDGCKYDTATHTLTVVCTSSSSVDKIYIQSNAFYAYENVALVGTDFTIRADWTNGFGASHTMAWSTTSDKIHIQSATGNSVHVVALSAGTATVTFTLTDPCGQKNATTYSFAIVDTQTPTINNPCTAPTLVGTYSAHKVNPVTPPTITAITGSIAAGTAIEIPFSVNHFPKITLSLNGTDFGSRRTGTDMQAIVTSAPAGSVYAPQTWEDSSYDFLWRYGSWDWTTTDTTTGVTTTKQYWKGYDSEADFSLVLNTDRNFFTTFLPDVAGTYTIDLIASSDCRTSSPSGYSIYTLTTTIKATCPTAPKLVLKDGKGTEISTSKANPAAVYLANTWNGAEYTVLDASKSTKSDGYQIYYHWYWKTVEHGYDHDDSEWEDDHVGLGTPFSPILTLDPKLIPPSHNGRELMLTISDGCQNVTTAVKIVVQCNSDNVNLQADVGTLIMDPLICYHKVNLRTGVCVNHYDFISVTLSPAFVSTTAAAIADTAFALNYKPIKEEDSGPNKTAIGLGIGLGLGIPILCLIGYCIYRSTRQRAPIKDSSSNHQQQHQQQHHQESSPAAAPAPVAEPAPAASPANTSPDDNNLAQNNGQPPSAVQDQKEAAPPV